MTESTNVTICTDCAYRNRCEAYSRFVHQCVNYEFSKRMASSSLCSSCLYSSLCLIPTEDTEITECKEYKKKPDG